jgi:hypothetical protein
MKKLRQACILTAIFLSNSEAQEIWTLRYSSLDGTAIQAVGGRPGLYLAASGTLTAIDPDVTVRFLRSEDGRNWTATSSLPRTQFLATDGVTIIGVGVDGIYTTADGISFTWAFKGVMDARGIATSGAAWVVVLSNGDILRAQQPTGPWEYQLSPTDTLTGIAYGNGVFLSGVRTGEIIKSTDGISWTLMSCSGGTADIQGFSAGVFYTKNTRSLDTGATWTSNALSGSLQVAAGPSRFLARTSSNNVNSSVSMTSWLVRETGFGTDSPVTAVAHCGDLWIAGGGKGKISTAPNVNAPAFTAPPVTIAPAVELRWPSITGRRYQVQGSSDNAAWTNVGLPLLGNGSTLTYTAPANETRKFFRVEAR